MAKHLPIAGTDRHAVVDDADFAVTSAYRWVLVGGIPYRRIRDAATGRESLVSLRREVTQAAPGVIVRNRDGDPLDCRRANLVVLDRSRWSRLKPKRRITSSRFRGVARSKCHRRWRAYLFTGARQVHLGYFAPDEEADAARARDAAARVLLGPGTQLNFPEEALPPRAALTRRAVCP